MNRDLHVIKEEDEYSNHLLNSVLKTMKFAGEANVDKICKKLRNNSNIQYSKFQVEKAVDTAVQKGIIELKNNVYKLKDTFENKDNKAFKPQEERDQSSNREQSGNKSGPASESELQVKSENYTQSCKKSFSSEKLKCPHCGIAKTGSKRTSKIKNNSKKMKEKSKASALKRRKKASHKKNLKNKKKYLEQNECSSKGAAQKYHWANEKDSNELLSLNSSYSDIDFLEAFEEESTKKEKNKLKRKGKRSIKTPTSPQDIENEKWSTFKSDSESESNGSFQKLPKKKKVWSPVTKLKKSEVPENDNSEVRKRSTSILVEDWLEHSNEPQGTIMQSNNLLQIEPMDLLVVKNPQPASYFM